MSGYEHELRLMIEIAVAANLPRATENDGKRVASRVIDALGEAGLMVVREGGTRIVDHT